MKNKIIKNLVVWLEPLLIIETFELFFMICNETTKQTDIRTIYIFMEFFVLYLFYLLLHLIFKKNYIAVSIFSISLFIFSIINQVVIYYTQSPIFFSDLLFIFSSSELVNIVGDTLFTALGTFLLQIVYYLTVTIFFILLAFNVKSTLDNKVIRYPSICAIVLFIVFLFNPTKGFRNYMVNNIYHMNKRVDYSTFIENIDYIGSRGILVGMYANYLENRIYKPDDYNDKEIEDALNNVNELDDNTFGKPNIIVVFAESFWNIDDVEDIKFDKKVAENYNNLKDKGIYFEMISPSYGGVSANVEFEFLTGANLMYFGKGFIPYMQLYTNSKYKNNPSIIQELKNNDYYTKIITYTEKTLFSCGRFYKFLDVDHTEYNYPIDKKYQKGDNVSDEYVFDKIIEEFENKEKGKKEFYMTLTMQGHMPYTKDKYDNYDIKLVESNYDSKVNEQLEAYAQGIYDMDKQIKRLYDYIQEYDEPTIIVFYGDHLPYLKYISQGKYFNTDDKLLNIYRKYNTESLILANFDIKEDNYKYLGPDLLGTYILNRMDIDISKYYKWLYKTIDILPSSNLYISSDKDGNVYNTNTLNDDMYDIYKLRRNVQYKYFIK